jgi:nucleoside-diphosphate-sugar epimerase
MGVYALQVDMPHRAAAIPGTGDDIISFTYSGDIAQFVEAALDLPWWDKELNCYSDCCSLNTVVKLAEEATGELDHILPLCPVSDVADVLVETTKQEPSSPSPTTAWRSSSGER